MYSVQVFVFEIRDDVIESQLSSQVKQTMASNKQHTLDFYVVVVEFMILLLYNYDDYNDDDDDDDDRDTAK